MTRRLGVDIDGVIADQTAAMVDYLSSKYSTSFSASQLRRGGSYIPAIGTDYTTEMRAAQSDNQYYPHMPPVDGALTSLERLAQRFEIVLVTHRPADTEAVTREWLTKHDVTFDELHVDAPDDKSDIGIDFLIDDRVGNVTNCARAIPLLFLREHNLERIPSNVWDATKRAQVPPTQLIEQPSRQWDAVTDLLLSEPAPGAVVRSSLF